MITVSATMHVPPARVFAVLADGWSYAGWVVGATHVRDVDAGWPAKGTRIHHSIGPWPLVLNDKTTVTEVEPDKSLEMYARLWPFGAARVRLELEETEPGHTTVHMAEELERGPLSALPHAVQSVLLVPRNRESLARLSHLATGRESDPVQR